MLILSMEQKEFIREQFEKNKNKPVGERNRIIQNATKARFGVLIDRHHIYRAVKDLVKEMESVNGTIHEDIDSHKEKREERETGNKYKSALVIIDDLRSKLESLASVKDRGVGDFRIEGKKSKKGEAAAMWVASDWHIEEVVDKDKVNGLNEYNPEIAQKRASLFFQNALKLTDMSAKDVQVRHVVLAALGDFVSGHIHPELVENNALSPVEAIALFRDIFNAGIRHVLKNSDYNLTVICKDGNHGRLTDKVRVSTRSENSIEWLIYNMIASDFKNDKRVKFIVEKGEQTYVPVFNTMVRFMHGDSVNFGGGVGGIHIPLRKAVSQWDKMKRADLTVLGHFHQLEKSKSYMVNGSLIGYNPYAMRIKADYETPQQGFCLIDKEWGASVFSPIRVTDSKND